MDGRWRDAEQFLAPLEGTEGFDYNQVLFELRRQKFLELLEHQSLTPAVVELVDGLKALEKECSREEFNSLCYLLTLGKLTDHPDFRGWTPHKGRLECFEACQPYFEAIYGLQSGGPSVPPNRLMELIKQATLHQIDAYQTGSDPNKLLSSTVYKGVELPPDFTGHFNADSRCFNADSCHFNAILTPFQRRFDRRQLVVQFRRRASPSRTTGEPPQR